IALLRGERRSFFCPNKLWNELVVQANDSISISTFIKQAVVEKMIREYPKKKEYFEDLLR
ncbi:MAG: hypothetical protein ABIH76_00060, partial [Candidatus Bathyarchaeota archaeon]